MDTSTAPHATEVGALGGYAGGPPWPALAAWGAGLIHLALGAGAITGAGEGSAIRVAGTLLAVVGAVAVGWGAVTLARGRPVAPRLGIAGSLAGIFTAAAAMALDPTRISVFAVTAASALLVVVALGCALALRRASRRGHARSADAARPRLIGFLVGALLVAAVVTPALAATEAGQHSVPHGEHTEFLDLRHH